MITIRASDVAVLADMSRFGSRSNLIAALAQKIGSGRKSSPRPPQTSSNPVSATSKSKPPALVDPSPVPYTPPATAQGMHALRRVAPRRLAANIKGDYASALGISEELQAAVRVWRALPTCKRTDQTMARLGEAVLRKYRALNPGEWTPVHPDMVRRLVQCCLRKVSGNDHELDAIQAFAVSSGKTVHRQQEDASLDLFDGGLAIRGRVDGVICGPPDAVLEVKTCTRTDIGGVPCRATREHVVQVHVYMAMLGLTSATLLYSAAGRGQSVVRVPWDAELWAAVMEKLSEAVRLIRQIK